MIGFRHVDPRYPVLWEESDQPATRFTVATMCSRKRSYPNGSGSPFPAVRDNRSKPFHV